MPTVAPSLLATAAETLDPADRALLDLWINRGLDDTRLAKLSGLTAEALHQRRDRIVERLCVTLALAPADVRDGLTAIGAAARAQPAAVTPAVGAAPAPPAPPAANGGAANGVVANGAGTNGATNGHATTNAAVREAIAAGLFAGPAAARALPKPGLFAGPAAARALAPTPPSIPVSPADGQPAAPAVLVAAPAPVTPPSTPTVPPAPAQPPPFAPAEPAAGPGDARRRSLWAAIALLIVLVVVVVVVLVASSGGGTHHPTPAPTSASASASTSASVSATTPTAATTTTTATTPAGPAGVGPVQSLAPLPGGLASAHGSAQLAGSSPSLRLRLTVSGLPARAEGSYEAFLYDSVVNSELLGTVAAGSSAAIYALPANAHRYRWIDIAFQPIGMVFESGESALRAPNPSYSGPATQARRATSGSKKAITSK